MAKRKTVSKSDAEKVLAQVKTTFKPYCEDGGDGPSLVENFDWSGAMAPFAVIWEGGPFEWVYLFLHGGRDGETGVAHEPADRVPGLFLEAETSWALGIYPAS